MVLSSVTSQAGGYVYVTAGWGTLTCFCAGALLNLVSAYVGVRTAVQGTCRRGDGDAPKETARMEIRSPVLLPCYFLVGGFPPK